MKNIKSERGQALILIALAAIGLFGIAGLAIDGSAKFSDRRHAQNAADTAALAGARALARGEPLWYLDAAERALENGYDDNHVSNEVEVHNPPTTGIYADCYDVHFDCHDYVEVIIDTNVNTFFARVVGIHQTHNHVEAVASKITENNSFNFGGNAVVALSPEGCALMGQGNVNVIIDGGGLYSNSDDATCSYHGPSCASTIDVNNEDGSQGAITLVGGYNSGVSCMPQADLLPASAKQISFPPPYQEIDEPAECLTNGTKTNTSTTTTLTPGYWPKIPGNGSTWKDNIVLTPGIYCIGTTLSTNANEVLKVSGTFGVDPGVFLYIKPGGSFTFNGGSGVQLWGIHDNTSPYYGFLMYLAPDYASGSPANCKINGHSGDAFMGAIFAPYCDITLSGTGDPNGFQTQLIGYNVKFAGGANIHLTYDSDSSPVWNIPLQVGLTK
jgi:putative Flp pilus-assembly TadE/G-like protein